jgi:hypothetical protein
MNNSKIRQIIRRTIKESFLLTENKEECYGKTTINGVEYCAFTEEYSGDCKKRSVSGVCTECACNDSDCKDCGDGGPAKIDPNDKPGKGGMLDADLPQNKEITMDPRVTTPLGPGLVVPRTPASSTLAESLLKEEKLCCTKCSDNVKIIRDYWPGKKGFDLSISFVANNGNCKCCCKKPGQGWACQTRASALNIADPTEKEVSTGRLPVEIKRLRETIKKEAALLSEEKTCCDTCRGNVQKIMDMPDKPQGVEHSFVRNNKDCRCCCAKTGGWACGDVGTQSLSFAGDAATPDPFQDYSRER